MRLLYGDGEYHTKGKYVYYATMTHDRLYKVSTKLFYETSKLADQDVEADETFVGGQNKNRHADKKVKYSQGRSFKVGD